MADSEAHESQTSGPGNDWRQASQRIHYLQRVQLASLTTIGVIVVLATLGAGIVFAQASGALEEHERELLELVDIRDETREIQVEILRRQARGQLDLTSADALRLVALVERAKRQAGEPTRAETDEGRRARLEVVAQVAKVDEIFAGSDPSAIEEQILDGTAGELIDDAFAALSAWVAASNDNLIRERERQQDIVARGGPAVGALVFLLTLLGLLMWWRMERERGHVINAAQSQSRRYDSLVSNASDVVIVMGTDGTVDYCSPSIERALGVPVEEALGSSLHDLVHPDDVHNLDVISGDHLGDRDVSKPIDLRLRRGDGSWMDGECLAKNLLADEAIGGFVLNCRDVSDRKEVEERLAHQAYHDRLTGLPNRTQFEQQLRDAVAEDPSERPPLAVLILDVDDFKTVNDTLGHHAGDEMLNVIGQRLQRCVRPADTPARLGGDEFGVIMRGLAGRAAVRTIAERIVEALREPIKLADKEFRVSSSVGIALSPRHGNDYATLTRHADIAMYAAKARPGVNVALFESGMEDEYKERMRLGIDLDRALVAGDQLRVVYQPIVDLESEAVSGVEALVRWEHPTDGLIMPDRFIPLAEANGLIVEIGELVLRTACADGARWQAETGRPMAVNVNVSPRQLEDSSFPDLVRGALEESGMAPDSLMIEITESALMGDVAEVVALLQRVRDLGVRVAIDDFGTGYSSLSQLRHLPVDMVKIDKAFIDDLVPGGPDSEVTGIILQLGAVLDLKTIAEGVEQPGQLTDLRRLGCEAGQGFLFAQPMEPAAITELLERDAGHLRPDGSTDIPGLREPN